MPETEDRLRAALAAFVGGVYRVDARRGRAGEVFVKVSAEAHAAARAALALPPEPTPEEAPGDDVERVWRTFWADIVAPGGALDVEAVKRELHDYSTILDEVPKVYMHVTDGRISKPNTHASAVIDVAEEREEERWKEYEKEVLEDEREQATRAEWLRIVGRLRQLRGAIRYIRARIENEGPGGAKGEGDHG